MAISVYFKTNGLQTKIADENIMKLHQSANMFSSSFRLGATVCRQFDLDIDKAAFVGGLNEKPDEVLLYENSSLYATLVIDELNTDNDAYYSYTLTDRMVRLNDTVKVWVVDNGTWQDQIDNICTVYELGASPTLPEYGSVIFGWSQDMTARDFVGYLAEVLGGYAFISADNKLVFTVFSGAMLEIIDVEDCSSFKVNEQITFDRVVYDTPNKVVKYPDDDTYTGTGATYYVNPNNQLMTDDTGDELVSIESEVQYIYNAINGFSFYNITVEKCPIDGDVKCGEVIGFTLDNTIYPTIAQIDWDYNSMWIGGYSLEVNNELQEETVITPLKSATNRITQYIDRELGEVGTRIETLEEGVSTNASAITQNAQQITLQVQALAQQIPDIVAEAGYITSTQLNITAEGIVGTINSYQEQQDGKWAKLETRIEFTPDGLIIGKQSDEDDPGSKVKGVFSNTSLDFIDDQGHKLAWLDTDEGLGATQVSLGDPNNSANRWRIFVSEDGDHLRFTRNN